MSREADAFLAACQEVQMKHPLENSEGRLPACDAPRFWTRPAAISSEILEHLGITSQQASGGLRIIYFIFSGHIGLTGNTIENRLFQQRHQDQGDTCRRGARVGKPFLGAGYRHVQFVPG